MSEGHYQHYYGCKGNDPECGACKQEKAETKTKPVEKTYTWAEMQSALGKGINDTWSAARDAYEERLEWVQARYVRRLIGASLFFFAVGAMIGAAL